MTTSFEPVFQAGTIITGKWNKGQYVVDRLLGEGANGKVYLVRKGTALYALKVGFDPVDHQSEVNALLALSRSSSAFRKYLHDVDDFRHAGTDYPFCVIRYIKGQPLKDYLRERGYDWVHIIGFNLLQKLSELHAQGYIFGDLKTDNMIISGYGEVNLVDFGGVTPIGRSIKQFTEVFDRGFWGAGTRVADEKYDLFSVAVLLLSVTDKEKKLLSFKHILPQNRNIDFLLDMLKGNARLSKAAPFIRKALRGEYRSTAEAFAEWRRYILHKENHKSQVKLPWLKICFGASIVLFASTLYFYWQ
ncbi:protein kinase domain-containing protein [Paenibacillus thalictri]|uniref:non-specific serine/threonine protein kinase n=1 Tax=Paenibacillus thalictri TaxID=2527873 RepID=A0A4Q9DD73_9BACL|nr:serine/threonine protein kinase [Paenibacillus thalictri]TBL69031.1 serine/threonine protein kinase [Paenibacillus thalictri]